VDSDLSHASPSGPSLDLPRAEEGGRTVSWCACSSGSTHRVLMSCCSNFVSSVTVMGAAPRARGDVLLDRRREQSPLGPEGPGKSSTAERELEAPGRGVQVCAPAGCSPRRIGDDLEACSPVTGDDSQQLSFSGPLPAPYARADAASKGLGGHAPAHAFSVAVANRPTVYRLIDPAPNRRRPVLLRTGRAAGPPAPDRRRFGRRLVAAAPRRNGCRSAIR
jgi:hypothetical protein